VDIDTLATVRFLVGVILRQAEDAGRAGGSERSRDDASMDIEGW